MHTIGAPHDATTPVLTVISMTHHTTVHPHVGVLQHIQETTVDPNQDMHTDQVRTHNINLHLNIAELQQILR